MARSQSVGGWGSRLCFGLLLGGMLSLIGRESSSAAAEVVLRPKEYAMAVDASAFPVIPVAAAIPQPTLAPPRLETATADQGTTLDIVPPAVDPPAPPVARPETAVPSALSMEVSFTLPRPAPAPAVRLVQETPSKPEVIPRGPVVRPEASKTPKAPQSEERPLTVEWLVPAVQTRNPSLEVATAAWRAAAEQYPQVVSLDDPMFGFLVSPGGLGVDNGGGYMLELSQKLPWPGKRQLRGERAAATAEAEQGDIGETRLRLAEAAKTAFYEYYLAYRLLEVNDKTTELMTEFRRIAKSRYEANQAMAQDVLQAELELAELQRRRAEVLQDRGVSVARINTLLHLAPTCPLPPPPKEISLAHQLPDSDALLKLAVSSRPELLAQGARIRAEEAGLALACKEYHPDLEVVSRYDATMEDERMRPMVGMNLNIPIRHERRNAAVRESQWRIQQQRAEYQRRVDEVQFDVQAARERVAQGHEIVGFYTKRILPAADEAFEAARVNYQTGRIDFLRLLEAERQYHNQRERYYQAIAQYFRRLAELERAVGCPVGAANEARPPKPTVTNERAT